jgi:hypothetical protein
MSFTVMAGLVTASRGLPDLRQYIYFAQLGQARVARAIHAFIHDPKARRGWPE